MKKMVLIWLLTAVGGVSLWGQNSPLENHTDQIVAVVTYDTDSRDFVEIKYGYLRRLYSFSDGGTKFFKTVVFENKRYNLNPQEISFYSLMTTVGRSMEFFYVWTATQGSKDWSNYRSEILRAISERRSYSFYVQRTRYTGRDMDYQFIVKVLPKLLDPVASVAGWNINGNENRRTYTYRINSNMHSSYVAYWQYRVADANGAFPNTWKKCVNGLNTNYIDFGRVSLESADELVDNRRVQVRYVTSLTDCETDGRASRPITFTYTRYQVPDVGVSSSNIVQPCGSQNGVLTGSYSSYEVYQGTESQLAPVDLNSLEAGKSYNLLFYLRNSIPKADQKPYQFSFKINNPLSIVSQTVTPPSCPGERGSVAVTFKGGTGSLSISLLKNDVQVDAVSKTASDDEQTVTFSNLQTGTYQVKLTDESYKNRTDGSICEVRGSSFDIREKESIRATSSVSLTGCYGGTSSATVAITGGTAPYSYLWEQNGEVAISTSSFSVGNLSFRDGRSYSYTVKDGNGCLSESFTVTATDPASLGLSVVSADGTLQSPSADQYVAQSCSSADGSVTVELTASGGSGGYTLSRDGEASALSTRISLAPRTTPYRFDLYDSNGCPTPKSITIRVLPKLELLFESKTNACGGADGSITLKPSGGSESYTFSAANGVKDDATGAYTFSNLAGGSYNITLNDGFCSRATGNIEVYSGVTFTASSTMDCTNDRSSITVTGLQGGDNSYSYTLSGSGSSTSGTFTGGANTIANLSSGTYSLSVASAGCSRDVSGIAVYNRPVIERFEVSSPTCPKQDVSVAYAVTGGRNPQVSYSLSFLDDNGASRTQATDLTGLSGSFALSRSGQVRINVDECSVSSPPKDAVVKKLTIGIELGDWKCDIKNGQPTRGTIKALIGTNLSGFTATLVRLDNNTEIAGTPGQTDAQGNRPVSFSVSEGGRYKVKVVATEGCTEETLPFTYQPESFLRISSTNTVDPVCNGGDGKVIVDVTGLEAGRTLTGSGTVQANGSRITFTVAPGSRLYTVSDGFCELNTPVVVVNNPPKQTFTATVTDPLCSGDDALVTFQKPESAGVLTYWVNDVEYNNASVQLPISLPRTTLLLKVRDAKGCDSDVLTKIITKPDPLTFGAAVDPVRCNGEANGAITLTPSGGTAPYTLYAVAGTNRSPITDGRYGGLAAGRYTVEVTDRNGCAYRSAVDVPEPPVLRFTATTVLPVCRDGIDGKILLDIADPGNGAPYRYSLNGQVGVLLPDDKSVAPVAHSTDNRVTLLDAKGCSYTQDNILVGNREQWLWNVTEIDPSCSDNGVITVSSIERGYGSYKLVSNSSPIPASLSGLAAGSYNVEVSDAKGCIQSYGATLEENPLAVDYSTTDVTCFGESTGSLVVTVRGGRPLPNGGYGYTLRKGSREYLAAVSADKGTLTFSNLEAGEYNLRVNDAESSGCIITRNITITQYGQPVDFQFTKVDATTCQTLGTITFTSVTGYQGDLTKLTYSVGANEQVGNPRFSVITGNYTLKVTDEKGCFSQKSVNVDPNKLTATLVTTPIDCSGSSNGAVQIENYRGGLGDLYTACVPYEESRQLPASGPDDSRFSDKLSYSGLAPGRYVVYGKDERNTCKMVIGDFEIANVKPLTLTAKTTPPDCNGGSNGAAAIQIEGGNGGYLFSGFGSDRLAVVEDGVKKTGFVEVSGLAAGSYPVSLTDRNGCTNSGSSSVVVQEPEPLRLSLDSYSDVSCKGSSDGIINLQAAGGNGGYRFTSTLNSEAFKEEVSTSAFYSLAKLAPGQYRFDVTDSKGCLLTNQLDPVAIVEPLELSLAVTSFKDLSCYGNSGGEITVRASGGNSGEMVYTIGTVTQSSPVFTNLNAASHTITVNDSKGCRATTVQELTEPPLLEVTSLNTIEPACFGGTGSISPQLSGGTAPYMVMVEGQAPFAAPGKIDLPKGDYRLIYRDANGCTLNRPFTINEPGLLVVNEVVESPLCTGLDGRIALTASGGTAPYRFKLDNGQYGESASFTVKRGDYGVAVEDSRGCRASKSVTVAEPSPLVLASEFTNPLCNGLKGTIQLRASGGTAPYRYAADMPIAFPLTGYTSGGAGQQVSLVGIEPGVPYQPAVMDANGCIERAAPVTLTQPERLVWLPDELTDLKCANDGSGAIKVALQGGTQPYSFTIPNSQSSTGSFTRLPAGEYQVSGTDVNGCLMQKVVTLREPAPLAVTTTLEPQRCFTSCNGEVAVLPSGGTLPYTISWSNVAYNGQNRLTGLCGGEYIVSIRDANGCSISRDLSFDVPEQIVLDVGFKDTTLCSGQTLLVQPKPQKWGLVWTRNGSFLANGSSYRVTEPGAYGVKAIDAKGCMVDFSFGVSYVPEVMNPEFLISSKVAATDTVIVVDVSNPKPVRVEWKIDPAARVVMQEGGYLHLVFDSEGTYTLGMVAHANGCAASIEKRIEVGPKEERFEINKSLGYREEVLKSFKILPNPNDGNFKVRIALNRRADVTLRLVSIGSGVVLGSRVLRGDNFYEVDYSNPELEQGYYVVSLIVDGRSYDLKLIKI